MPPLSSKTVVFIHGMYMTPSCWEDWVRRFAERGYQAMAPAWPGREGKTVAELRDQRDPRLGELGLPAIVDHYARILRALPQKPIIVGHSMGGLVVQLLLQQGLAEAGVAIDSAPPQGFVGLLTKWAFKWSFVKANWQIGPFKSKATPHVMTLEEFRYGWAHTLPEDAQRRFYERYVVPESRRVGEGPTTDAALIDFSREHAPLLLIAGVEDRTIPVRLNQDTYAAYLQSPSITNLLEVEGRTHLILNQPGWEEVADDVLGWIAGRGHTTASQR